MCPSQLDLWLCTHITQLRIDLDFAALATNLSRFRIIHFSRFADKYPATPGCRVCDIQKGTSHTLFLSIFK